MFSWPNRRRYPDRHGSYQIYLLILGSWWADCNAVTLRVPSKGRLILPVVIAISMLRVKIFCYSLLFKVQRMLVRAARALPGCSKVLGIPRQEILNIEEWVKNRNRTAGVAAPMYRSFGEPMRVPRLSPAPPGVDRIHPNLQHDYLEFRAPFLATIPSAQVLGPDGCVITPDQGVLKESPWSGGLFQQDRIHRSLRLPTPQSLLGSYYTIAGPYSSGYYHWIVEVLPRLFAYELVANDSPRLIVNSPLNRWQLESLEVLGFSHQGSVELGPITHN